jgi:hypothetical protein
MTVDQYATIRGATFFNIRGGVAAQVFAQGDGTGSLIARVGKGAESPGAGISYYDGQTPTLAMKGADGKFFVEIKKEGTHLDGPFAVHDRAGKTIATIQSETVTADPTAPPGGPIKTMTIPRGVAVYGPGGGVASQLTVDASGNGRVKVLGPSGANGGAQAGLMITKDGSLLALANGSGKVTADVSSHLGFASYNTAGQRLVEIGATQSGSSGRLWLGDTAGVGLVEAGMLSSGVGTVRAGPSLGGGLGLPSAIVGVKK